MLGMQLPNGIEYRAGVLYVATPKQISRYDNIEDHLDKPPERVDIYDKLPGDIPHGWKLIMFGPDDNLYVPVGAPCNICELSAAYAPILCINADGSGTEVVARGVRNTVGFDVHPRTKELSFTDNPRDWLSKDMPIDESPRRRSAAPNALSGRQSWRNSACAPPAITAPTGASRCRGWPASARATFSRPSTSIARAIASARWRRWPKRSED